VRRFGRILFLLAAAASLVLCLAAAGAWGLSYAAAYSAGRWVGDGVTGCVVSRGTLGLFDRRGNLVPATTPAATPRWEFDGEPPTDLCDVVPLMSGGTRRAVAGFYAGRGSVYGLSFTLALAPLWSVVAAFAVLPLSAAVSIVRRRRRARRAAAGLCPACGYDLRATPDRCPECGRAAEAGAPPQTPRGARGNEENHGWHGSHG
jgi:hypothetical protein